MRATMRLLGTGPAGGAAGRGRSRRRESSALLVGGNRQVLVDVTRDFAEQAARLPTLDAVVLTHGHADAIGGIARLQARRASAGEGPIPTLATPGTLAAVHRRFAGTDHLEEIPMEPGEHRRLGRWTLTPLAVPHAADEDRFPTCAWRFAGGGIRIVYASDVARPTGALEVFSRGADLLVADGATYGRRIFSHLRIDEDLPTLCSWDVGRIVLTQIGRSAPSHEELVERVRELCPRAEPGFDGMEISRR